MPVPRSLALIATTLLLSGWPTTSAQAQIRASELATVSQVVDGTTVRITYSRPRLRGRTAVFGTRAASWGEVWTPGANWSTTLEVDAPIELSGTSVPKGKYGVWMIISQDSTWTMLLDPEWRQFHMAHPGPSAQHIQVKVRADANATPSMDVLTWSFPAVTARGATIAMQWATTRVTMDYKVTPTLTALFPQADASRYVGQYAIQPFSATDTSTARLIVTYEGGGLKARFEPMDDYMQTFALMPVAPDYFTAGLFMSAEVYADGEIYEVLRPDFMLTFSGPDSARVIEARDASDGLEFTARRVRR